MKDYFSEFNRLEMEIASVPRLYPDIDKNTISARNTGLEEENQDFSKQVFEFWGGRAKDVFQILDNEISKLNFSWSRRNEERGALYQTDASWSISGYSVMVMYLENDPTLTIGSDVISLANHNYLLNIIDRQKFLPLGQFNQILLLVRPEGESHSLHLYWNDRKPPSRLSVKLREFLDCAIQVRGITEFPIYLTEKFPEQLEKFRYSGFFEKVERLFPDANLDGFRHRERCDFKESVVLRDGRLDFSNRIQEAFLFMPDGTMFQRWHPKADVLVFPDTGIRVRYFQLLYGVKFSDEMEAYYNASQKLEVCWKVDGSVKGWFNFPRLQGEIFPKGHAPQYYGLSPDDEPHLAGKYVFYTDQYNDMLVQFEGDGRCSFHLLYLEADDYATHYITDDFDWLFTQLLNARGMYWWNYFLVFEPSAGDQRYLQFHRQMREYFPDADMSLYPDPEDL